MLVRSLSFVVSIVWLGLTIFGLWFVTKSIQQSEIVFAAGLGMATLFTSFQAYRALKDLSNIVKSTSMTAPTGIGINNQDLPALSLEETTRAKQFLNVFRRIGFNIPDNVFERLEPELEGGEPIAEQVLLALGDLVSIGELDIVDLAAANCDDEASVSDAIESLAEKPGKKIYAAQAYQMIIFLHQNDTGIKILNENLIGDGIEFAEY